MNTLTLNENLELNDKFNSILGEGKFLEDGLDYLTLYLEKYKLNSFNQGLEQLFFQDTTKEIIGTEENIFQFLGNTIKLAIRKFAEFLERVYNFIMDWGTRIINIDTIENSRNNKRIKNLINDFHKLTTENRQQINELIKDASIKKMVNKAEFVELIKDLHKAVDLTVSNIDKSIKEQMTKVFDDVFKNDAEYPWINHSYTSLLNNLGITGITVGTSHRLKYNSIFMKKNSDNFHILGYDSLQDVEQVQKTYDQEFTKYKQILKLPGILRDLRLKLKIHERDLKSMKNINNTTIINNISYLRSQIQLGLTIIRYIREANMTIQYRIETLIDKCASIMKTIYNRQQISEKIKK